MNIDVYDKRKFKIDENRDRSSLCSGEYKLITQVYIINDKNELLIQRRAMNKKTNPGMWAITTGFVDTTENSFEASIRETKEELGINLDPDNLELVAVIKGKTTFLEVWCTLNNTDIKDIVIQEEELSEVKWVSFEEVEELLKKEQIILDTYEVFKAYIDHMRGE